MAYLDGIKKGDKLWWYPAQEWITYCKLQRGILCHCFVRSNDTDYIHCDPRGRTSEIDKIPSILWDETEVLDPNNLPQRPYKTKEGDFVEWQHPCSNGRQVGKVEKLIENGPSRGRIELVDSKGQEKTCNSIYVKPYKPQEGDLVVSYTEKEKSPVIIGIYVEYCSTGFHIINSDGFTSSRKHVEPFIGHKPTML